MQKTLNAKLRSGDWILSRASFLKLCFIYHLHQNSYKYQPGSTPETVIQNVLDGISTPVCRKHPRVFVAEWPQPIVEKCCCDHPTAASRLLLLHPALPLLPDEPLKRSTEVGSPPCSETLCVLPSLGMCSNSSGLPGPHPLFPAFSPDSPSVSLMSATLEWSSFSEPILPVPARCLCPGCLMFQKSLSYTSITSLQYKHYHESFFNWPII